ncbi:MAG: energy-coupling factor transporter transmembrane protein EcfT [Ruminococcaceae bacterium]|nr:energy-coupling factor transporter transmembrane protein EcfT [Oscillospiraceae bacterium]
MTISLGQYIPTKSVVHRADPRTKFLAMIGYMVAVMLIETFIGYGIATLFVISVYLVAKLPMKYVFKSIRPVIYIVLFTMLINLFIHDGHTVWFSWRFITIYKESVFYCIKIMLRVILLVMGASVLTYTTASTSLTDGLESLMSPLKIIRFPAHDIAMMMSIALRFIPTFADELDRIVKAQMARGADFDSKNIIKKVRSYIPVLIPLFVSAWRRAADLANAMNARGYRGGEGRTKYRVLKFTLIDLVMAIIMILFISLIVILRILL